MLFLGTEGGVRWVLFSLRMPGLGEGCAKDGGNTLFFCNSMAH